MSWDFSWELDPSTTRETVIQAAREIGEGFPGVRFGAVVDPDLAEFAEEIESDEGGELLLAIPREVAEAYDDVGDADDDVFEGQFHFLEGEDGTPPRLVIYSNDSDNRACWSALGELVGYIASQLGAEDDESDFASKDEEDEDARE
jgi:hypothetical protein